MTRVKADATDGSPAAQFAAFTSRGGLERDLTNVQEVRDLMVADPPFCSSSKWMRCRVTALP